MSVTRQAYRAGRARAGRASLCLIDLEDDFQEEPPKAASGQSVIQSA